jgi:hypothetical protein
MPRVGFEPMIRSFEWAKTPHALDRVATASGCSCHVLTLITRNGLPSVRSAYKLVHLLFTSTFTVFPYADDFDTKSRSLIAHKS